MQIYIEINKNLCFINSTQRWVCNKDKELERELNELIPNLIVYSYLPKPEYHIAMKTAELYGAEVVSVLPEKGDDDTNKESEEGLVY